MESNDEIKALLEGLVAVKFSKGFKQQIRRPWVRALIVKVYGHSFGFNYLQNRLLSLWRPARRLDFWTYNMAFSSLVFYCERIMKPH